MESGDVEEEWHLFKSGVVECESLRLEKNGRLGEKGE